MKILGICGSPRSKKLSACYKILEHTLEATGMEYEIVRLGKLNYTGCIACLGCVSDNVCRLHDDLRDLRNKIIEADAYVIASPNYYSGMSAFTRAFLERWFQFRHRGNDTTWGKLAVAIGVGSMSGEPVLDEIEKMLMYNFVKIVAKISLEGNPSCFYCGYGNNCEVGVPKLAGISCPPPDKIPSILDDPANREAAENAGRLLAKSLREGYDRRLTSLEMQERLSERFQESV